MAGRRRLLAALLVTGDAAREIDGLRRALGSSSLGRIAPHVTLVPPVNVAEDALGAIEAQLRAVAATRAPLEVELGPPATFAPRTPVVYLALSGDVAALHDLRDELARGPLAAPVVRERRAFIPHVTVASRIEPARIPAALEALGAFRLETTLATLALFAQDQSTPRRPWRVVADATLDGGRVVGRGGRELTFALAERLDDEAAAWLRATWQAYALATYGPKAGPDVPFALTARHDGRLVGAAAGEVRGEVLALERLIVAAAHRGEGIGAQLLAEVERLGRARGCSTVRLATIASGPAAEFYARFGYRGVAQLPAWRGGRDFVVMVRRLVR